MEELLSLFKHNNIIVFKDPKFDRIKCLRIVVKNHVVDIENKKEQGITYYILDEGFKISSKLLRKTSYRKKRR